MERILNGLPRTLVRLLAGLGLLLVIATGTPVVSWWARALAGPWNDPSGDVLIVLGGSMLDQQTLGQSSLLRSNYAVRAYQQHNFRHVVLSGGGEPSIADAMRDYLKYRGVPESVMRVERNSQNTHENALYAKETLTGLAGTKVILTSDYHMFRAYRAFRKAGIEVLPRPIPDVLKRASSLENRWGAFVDLTRETVSIAYYFARGWI